MLKYKLKENSIKPFSLNYLKDYLIGLGVENPDSFIIEPRPEDEEHYSKLENIEEACRSLYKGFKEGKRFFLQIDSDADGYTSSAIFYAFFKKLFPDADIQWRVHEAKQHGVILNTVPIGVDYIIIPDAGTQQTEEQKILVQQGHTVIILDHHDAEGYEEIENVILVNNQASPRFKNKFLSGAGIVYKTIQCFNYMYQDEFPMIYEDYADLAALGIVADSMDIRNLDNNFIITKGLKNIKNPMFRAILEKQDFSIKDIDNPTKIDLAFYVAPLINAVIRFGSEEEKEDMFDGLITYERGRIMETEYRGEIRKENFHDYVARIAGNARARQNREKTKSMEFLSERIEENDLHKNQFIIVKASLNDSVQVPKTLTGLIAGDLVRKYNRPTLVLRPKTMPDGSVEYRGSARAKINGEFTSSLQVLRDSGLCTLVEGHDLAHGVWIPEENLQGVLEYVNDTLSDIEFDVDQYEVDYIFHNGNIDYEMIRQFGSAIHIFGHMLPQPKFAFNLRVSTGSIVVMGANKNTFKFAINGVEFIKFRAEEIVKMIEEDGNHLLEFEIVGRAQINEWQGRETPQIIMDDVSVKPIVLEDLF